MAAALGVAVGLAWLLAWGAVVLAHPQPLGVDRWASRVLTVDQAWQDRGLRLLRVEGPLGVAIVTVAVAALAAARRAPLTAVGLLAGVAVEIASVQWVFKPLFHRHEIAPDLAFPSSHVGAVVAGAVAIVVVARPAGPLLRATVEPVVRVVGGAVVALAVMDALTVALATIATGGHLFSDVVAVIPWAVAVPAASVMLMDRPAGLHLRTSTMSRKAST